VKILFVLEHYYPFIGGAEVLFKHLCEGLAEKGHNITVLTTKLPGTIPAETINGVNIHRISTPRKSSRYWFTFVAIPEAIHLSASVDIIHTTTYNGAFPAWLAARIRGKKCIITILEIIGKGWKEMSGMNWLSAIAYRFLEDIIISLRFDHFSAISHYTAGCLKTHGIDSNRISVIYPGINYALFDPRRADGKSICQKLNLEGMFIYLFFGRPGISKGVEYLLQAVPLINRVINNSKLLMILAHEPSDGYDKIIKLLKTLDIQNNAILLDPVPRDDLPNYIAAADCVIVPSLSEGFGFSAAEACAMSKPVIASNTASLPEVVSGVYKLVEPKDAPSIARAVVQVYNRKFSSHETKLFMWASCITAYEEVYHQLVPKQITGQFVR
jgi:glycosyltransferase involved in cell wall biosynthesis